MPQRSGCTAHEHQHLPESIWKSESPEPAEQGLAHSGVMCRASGLFVVVKKLHVFLKKCACMRAKLDCDQSMSAFLLVEDDR